MYPVCISNMLHPLDAYLTEARLLALFDMWGSWGLKDSVIVQT